MISMSNGTIITLRVSNEFKSRIREAARRRNKSLSAYIKERIASGIGEKTEKPHTYSKAALKALKQYIGGSSHGHTTEDIDKDLYKEG